MGRMALIRIYSSDNCHACNVAKRAFKASQIPFEDLPLSGIDVYGSLPISVNSANGKRINGWLGDINKVRRELGIC